MYQDVQPDRLLEWSIGVMIGFWLVAMFITGCATSAPVPPPLPATYHVVVDQSFSDQERQDVVAGIDAWTAAVGPDLTWSYSTATPDQLGSAPGRAANELDLLRLSSLDNLTEPCLLQGGPYACYAAGLAYFGVDDLFANSDALDYTAADTNLQTLSSHEVGHFLGMVHTDEISVMQADLQSMAPRPTAYDVDTYCAYHRCPIRLQRDF